MNDLPNITWKTVPVTDELVLVKSYKGYVPIMVQPWWLSEPRHYVVKKDAGGWYVRTGKRGSVKEYLAATARITVIDGEDTLTIFKTERPAR